MAAGGRNPEGSSEEDQRAQTREEHKETFRIIKEMSDILNTGLDTQSLGFCLRLCEEGVNPEPLAHLIKDWREKKAETPGKIDGS